MPLLIVFTNKSSGPSIEVTREVTHANSDDTSALVTETKKKKKKLTKNINVIHILNGNGNGNGLTASDKLFSNNLLQTGYYPLQNSLRKLRGYICNWQQTISPAFFHHNILLGICSYLCKTVAGTSCSLCYRPQLWMSVQHQRFRHETSIYSKRRSEWRNTPPLSLKTSKK